jgi:hypothetical protein
MIFEGTISKLWNGPRLGYGMVAPRQGRGIIGSQIKESAAYYNQKLLDLLYLDSTQKNVG